MKTRFLLAGFLTAAVMAAPLAARAQQSPDSMPHLEASDMGQYPSVIEFVGRAVGGPPDTKFTLRCGYTVTNGQIAPDPTTNDLSLGSFQTYTRYQFIDGKPVITALDTSHPSIGDGKQVKIQVTEPDGSVKSKTCTQSNSGDALQNCVPTSPFLNNTQVSAAMGALASQCGQFMGGVGAQINPAAFDAQKTQAWKARLTQNLAIVEQ